MSDDREPPAGTGEGGGPDELAGDGAGAPANDGEDIWTDAPYVESQVIMTTVKVVAPFVLTYGLFVTFHGADAPGGGFQGGAIVGATVLMIAFAFGIESTRRWLGNWIVVGLATGGVAVFTLVGLGSMLLGGSFLEYGEYPIYHATKYGIEAVEIGGIALIVSGVVVGLFFATAAGYPGGEEL